MKALLVANLVSTLYMLGVIAVVQVVHYPLFAKVGQSGFVAYEQEHTRLITLVVMLPMIVELLSSFGLALAAPFGLPGWMLWLGVALVLVIWGSTALLQVPAHSALSSGFDASAHRKLVATNWIRTLAWMARAGLVATMVSHLMRPA